MNPVDVLCPQCGATCLVATEGRKHTLHCQGCNQSFASSSVPYSLPPLVPPSPPSSVAANDTEAIPVAKLVPYRIAKRARREVDEVDEEDAPPKRHLSNRAIIGMFGLAIVAALAILAGIGATLFYALRNDDDATNPTKSVAMDAVNRIKKSTVMIRCDHGRGQISSGSGFFAGPPGTVVTNAHVIGRGPKKSPPILRIDVIIDSGEPQQRTVVAEVLAVDPHNDLALLRVEPNDVPEALPLNRSRNLESAQELVIYGFPLGESLGTEISVTTTTMSSLRRTDGIVSAIQVNGGMHPGNSGGPLATRSGEVVGVCVAGIQGTTINFAIPGEKAISFLEDCFQLGLYQEPAAKAAGIPRGMLPGNSPPKTNPPATTVAPSMPAVPSTNPPPPVRPPVIPNPPVKPPMKPPLPDPPVVYPAPTDTTSFEVPLGGRVGNTCVGGDGRYFILHLPAEKKLLIFDAMAGKIAHTITLSQSEIKFAAGRSKLIVIGADPPAADRYDLKTFKLESTNVPPFDGKVHTVAMGSNSNGPMLVMGARTGGFLSAPVVFYDPIQSVILPFSTTINAKQRKSITLAGSHFRVSPDGTEFASWVSAPQNHPMELHWFANEKLKSFAGSSYGMAIPVAGSTLVTAHGLFTSDFQPCPGDYEIPRYHLRIPSVTGQHYLTLHFNDPSFPMSKAQRSGPQPAVYMVHKPQPYAVLPKVEIHAEVHPTTSGDFALDKRVFFAPDAKIIAVVPKSNDRLIVHAFDPDAAIERSGLDYLYVKSNPPPHEKGKPYTYAIVAKCFTGPLTFSIDKAPAGMVITAEGELSWTPPPDFSKPVRVSIRISRKDSVGILHEFDLAPGR